MQSSISFFIYHSQCQLSAVKELLTLCQDALDTVAQDDGSSLDVQAVEQVGGLDCGHPLPTGTLHEVHYLQWVVGAHQPARTHNLERGKEQGQVSGCLRRPTVSETVGELMLFFCVSPKT